MSLTRADGTVTASWPAVSGADKYHATYSTDGGSSWHAPVSNHTNITTNGITFNADNAKSYVVGVRAGNDNGWSGWRNSASSGPYTPPQPTPTPTPSPQPPGAVASVSLTRADGTVTADWQAVSGATHYHVTYSADGGGSWQAPVSNHTNITTNSVTFNADNAKTYIVGVRAGNADGWSGWVNSPAIGPYTPQPTPTPTPEPTPEPTPTPAPAPPDTPSSVTVTRGDGTVSASWPAAIGATKYHITYSFDGKRSWTAASDNHAETSITFTANNGKTYHVGVRAGNSAGWSSWRNSAASAPTATPGIIIQDTSGNDITALSVPEGGEVSYQVKLASQPDAYVEICIGLSVRDRNDGSITFKGEPTGTVALKVPFTPQNWDTFQTVTLVAAEDDDFADGIRDVIHDTRDFVEYYSGAVWVPATEVDNDQLSSPGNLSVTPGDGHMDIAWNAVTGATGYDVKAKTSGAANWHDVASDISTTSHRYNTTANIDYVAVRARSGNVSGPWTELSRAPSETWLNTVQQSGGAALAMAQSQAQGQSQLSAPASITVTRENSSIDEKLYVTWAAVSGAGGYNLACAASPKNVPLASWSWWHCGSVTDGTTTSFTVDNDGRSGENNNRNAQDLGWDRAYTVAVRAVTSNASDASPWLLSTNAHPATQPVNITVSRAAGSVSVSWELSVAGTKHTRGYEIECATRENNVTGEYTRCADVESATFTNRAITVTISSWTAGGTNYTIDNSKIYDLSVRMTNAWGESPWNLAPLIYVGPVLAVSEVGPTTATLTIEQHTGNWYYKADLAPDNTCQGPVSGTSEDLTGLAGGATYTYSAYSDSTCTTANLLTTAASFTTQPSVSNLTSPKRADFSGAVNTTSSWAVAFTTGSNAGGYTLKSFTAPLKIENDPRKGMGVALHAMSGTGDYSTSSEPASTAISGATFSGTDPSTTEWADTAYTCTGSGCKLSADTTYFVVLTYDDVDNYFRWAVATSAASEVEVALPSDNGWSIGYGHYTSSGTWVTHETPDLALAGLSFTIDPLSPTLSVSTIGVVTANLTIANHTGSWYYKATTGPHTACQGPISRGGQSLSGLTANTSYTYSAYSDSTCATLLATASSFTTLSSASNLTATNAGGGKITGLQLQAVAFTTGGNSTGYTLKNVTLPLKKATQATSGMIVELRPMDGTGTYSSSSKPTESVLATLSGASPTSTSWTDLLYTCSSGCSLAANTTYFVVAWSGDLHGYEWAYANSASDTLLPSGNGWSIGFDHYKNAGNWGSWSTKNLARVFFSTD